ncbi:MAG: hypothetical protein K0R65_996 [Crocinitomicaceae bacterium]|jgi:hypothetical protein|nr:hypothetical protein [Crocinitomicaceae bacterium]
MNKFLLTVFIGASLYGRAQNAGSVTGNIESIFQYLQQDSVIGANPPAEKGLLNTYANVFYTNGNFKAGMRLESYLPRIQGYPDRFDGTGIGMRYVGYSNDFLDITLGNFYEQFGSGLIFRSYEDRSLGYDSNMDGARLIVKPRPGFTIKGVYGHQRYEFREGRVNKSDGIVRGFDGEAHLNEIFKKMAAFPLDITFGGSFVSKYQKDNDLALILPENVGAYGGRTRLKYKNFTFDAEYVFKENDPNVDNGYIYNNGHAALFNLSYTKKGIGIIISGKSVDNMAFRSDRDKDGQDLLINFLPAMNKTHTYNLVATLYPYATQPNGEVAYQAEFLYTFKKDSKIGGKYGMPVNLNFSTAYLPIRHSMGLDTNRRLYEGRLFDQSDSLLWQDFNFNVTRKINKNLNFTLAYFAIRLNNDVAKISNDLNAKGIIDAQIGVLETNWKINKKHAIRSEYQMLFTNKDKGDWATLLVEYTISPNWFFGVMDQFNYGNPHRQEAIDNGTIGKLFSPGSASIKKADYHFPIVSCGFVREASRFMVSYGRQRAGLFCVGGICRFVPASKGLTLTFTHSF